MTTGRPGEDGIPRSKERLVVPPGRSSGEEDWHGANQAKAEKLRQAKLKRSAGAGGFELRHSAYGYALIDSKRQLIEGRNDMTLDEIEAFLGLAR